MEPISFLHAWQLWAAGKSLIGYSLWGMPMLWWGRIGKLAEFSGGLAAVIDIVGPERFAAWGEKLKNRPVSPKRRTFERTVARTREIYSEVYGDLMDEAVRYYAMKRPGMALRYNLDPPKRQLDPEARRVRRMAAAGFILLVIALWSLAFLHLPKLDPRFKWLAVGLAFVVLFTGYVILSMVITVVSVLANLVSRGLPLTAYYLFVWPVTKLLVRTRPDRPLRIAGILLITGGFAFDLLAT